MDNRQPTSGATPGGATRKAWILLFCLAVLIGAAQTGSALLALIALAGIGAWLSRAALRVALGRGARTGGLWLLAAPFRLIGWGVSGRSRASSGGSSRSPRPQGRGTGWW